VKRVLLDHCVPRRVARALPDCEITTAYRQGWAELRNGDLLRAVEDAGFEIFITADKNVWHQQNLRGRRLAIIVLPTNTLSRLLPLFPVIADMVSRVQPGDYCEININP